MNGQAAIDELVEIGRRQESALRDGNVDEAVRLGALRAAAGERVARALSCIDRGEDFTAALERARASNVRSRRLARSLSRAIQRELESLGLGSRSWCRCRGGGAPAPRYLDRIG